MEKIRGYGLEEVIREVIAAHTPFLGICLGLQLLFERSEESRGVKGLGILKGEILRIPEKADLKIPHIGWNSLTFPNQGRLFTGIPENSYVYFVHSYYLKAAEEKIVTAATEYGTVIHASVEKDNIFACQFHPEKSSETGLAILKNFISITRENL
jgi:glutamine amidotransferase